MPAKKERKRAGKTGESWQDRLCRAVEASQLSGYRIAKEADIQQSQLARILRGEGCELATAERIGRVVGLDLLPSESAELD
jgi:predicted transcriptional regulator